MKDTKIDWADDTWNPTTGCVEVSPGCDNCYARELAEKRRGTPAFPVGFDLQLRPHKLLDPLKRHDSRMIFVNSMSDVFFDEIDDDYIARIFAAMAVAKWHTFQVLTKRHGRMRALLNNESWVMKMFDKATDLLEERLLRDAMIYETTWPLPNVWVGVSVEDQKRAELRIPALLQTPAAVRFLSCEPLLGALELTPWIHGLHWIIDGGESGPRRRPGDYDWFRSLRDQCAKAGVPYLHKQGFAYVSGRDRELDGRTHDEWPPFHTEWNPQQSKALA